MRDAAFRAEQHARLHDPHVAPFTALVDELRGAPGHGWMPYVAPLYGGVHARVLSVFQDPGPKTEDGAGSGMICCENDDPSAELHATLLAEAGIPYSDVLPWNAYPWFRHRRGSTSGPSAAQLDAGVEPLRRVVALAPELRVVMLHGRVARDGWRRFRERHGVIARRLVTVETFHTSRQAFIGGAAVREERMDQLRRSFAEVAEILRSADVPSAR